MLSHKFCTMSINQLGDMSHFVPGLPVDRGSGLGSLLSTQAHLGVESREVILRPLT